MSTCFVVDVASETQPEHQKLLQAYEQATNCSRNWTPCPCHLVCQLRCCTIQKEATTPPRLPAGSRKREYTSTFTNEDSAKVGKYAAENRVLRAQKQFLNLDLGESTVRHFRKKYLAEVAERAKNGDTTKVTKLPCGQHGQKVALGENIKRV